MDRPVSDLKLDRVECPKCGAIWLNGQHTWATGAIGNEYDLAGLVCNKLGDKTCINPMKGSDGGDTWEKRFEDLESGFAEKRTKMEQQTERFKSEFGSDPHFDDN
jgi:hypothetical protein